MFGRFILSRDHQTISFRPGVHSQISHASNEATDLYVIAIYTATFDIVHSSSLKLLLHIISSNLGTRNINVSFLSVNRCSYMNCGFCVSSQYEPRHDKTNKMSVLPANSDQPGICLVWSKSSLCAQSVAEKPSFLHEDSEDSDQTARMPRLIWVLAGRTAIVLGLSFRGLYDEFVSRKKSRRYRIWKRIHRYQYFINLKKCFFEILASTSCFLQTLWL